MIVTDSNSNYMILHDITCYYSCYYILIAAAGIPFHYRDAVSQRLHQFAVRVPPVLTVWCRGHAGSFRCRLNSWTHDTVSRLKPWGKMCIACASEVGGPVKSIRSSWVCWGMLRYVGRCWKVLVCCCKRRMFEKTWLWTVWTSMATASRFCTESSEYHRHVHIEFILFIYPVNIN